MEYFSVNELKISFTPSVYSFFPVSIYIFYICQQCQQIMYIVCTDRGFRGLRKK